MAFYKSKYTGTEIDQRLTQGTYDDAVKAGFTGSKEEFDKIIVAFDENAQQKLDAAQPKIDHRLETLNKSIVDAINELHDEVNQKQDVGDYTDKEEFEAFKDEVAATYATKGELKESNADIDSKISTINNNLVESINTINRNIADGFNTINGGINNEIRPAIEKNTEDINNLKPKVAILESLHIVEVTPDDETYAASYELQDDTGKVYGQRINIATDKFIKSVSYESGKLVIVFAMEDGSEYSQTIDLSELVDVYTAGAGIVISEGQVSISNDTLTKIQYADSEVRRLEQDKIPYAYDEKTQSNINIILPEGGSYLGNYGDENATIAKAAVYDGIKQLELGSSKVHTNINTDSDVTIETSTGKKTIATTDKLVNVVNIPIRNLQDKIYTQEEILDWFNSTDVIDLKNKIVRGSIMYLKFGISLSGNPMYYKMPIEYIAFESANQIKLVFVGLNTRDDVTSKYEILINLDGTIIEGNSNVKLTLLSLEPDLSNFATKEEVPNVFETKGLTELEMGESSANIEAALGIDFASLIEIIKENKAVIVDRNSVGDYKACIYATGNISSGNGEANLMFFIGTKPTIYQIQYVNGTFALAVTEYEFAEKSALVLKQDVTDNSLETTSKTVSGAINEVRASVEDIHAPYQIDLQALLSASDTESISAAIGTIQALNNVVSENRAIVGSVASGTVGVSIRVLGNTTSLYYILDTVLGYTVNEINITNDSGVLSKQVVTHAFITENRVVNSLDSDETTLPLSAAQGKVLATDKQNKTDETLDTTNKTVVGAINEILPKATGVGKVDPNSDGTGEIFNHYEDKYPNTASGRYSHAEGWNTTASKNYSHAEGRSTIASGNHSHAEGNNTTASGGSSHAEGYQTEAAGDYSHAEGHYTQTFSSGEHAEGYWNKSYDSKDNSVRVIHSVGIGSGENSRKNAHEIKFNGDHYVYGVGGFDGTNSADAQTLQEVINSKQATITAGTGLEFEGNTLNVTLDTTVFKVVSVLPDSPAQGDENKIHLVPAESTGANNAYTEYVWVNSAWEILGEYISEVDLTPYLKTVDAQATYATKIEFTAHTSDTENPHGVTAAQVGLGDVDNTSDEDKPISTATQAALDLKQDITDNTLETISKTVPGAINETKTRIDNIDQTLDLKKVFAYGVEWTDEGILTSSALTRIGNLQMHKDLPIQSAMYGCIVKNGALQYKLGATNWAYKEDMVTSSVLDGTDGGIYVHIPKFYLWSEDEGTIHRVYISLLPLVPDALEVPEMYVSAEKVTLDRTDGSNIKTASVVNTTANFRGGNNSADYDTYLTTDPARCFLGKPATNIARANMRTYARNNGEELLCYDWYKAIYWLYVIEYGNFNCQLAYNAELTVEGYKQGGLGNGVTTLNWTLWQSYNNNNPIVPCGYNYEIGNGTGVKALTLMGYNENAGATVSVPRWRGLCSPFGDIWTNIDGVYIQQIAEGADYKLVYGTHNPEYFGETNEHMDYLGEEVRSEGYITSFSLRNLAHIIPLTVSNSNVGMRDYHYISVDNVNARCLLMGGNAGNGSRAGFGYWSSELGLANINVFVGFRTVIVK